MKIRWWQSALDTHCRVRLLYCKTRESVLLFSDVEIFSDFIFFHDIQMYSVASSRKRSRISLSLLQYKFWLQFLSGGVTSLYRQTTGFTRDFFFFSPLQAFTHQHYRAVITLLGCGFGNLLSVSGMSNCEGLSISLVCCLNFLDNIRAIRRVHERTTKFQSCFLRRM